jgi:hypothetical protein
MSPALTNAGGAPGSFSSGADTALIHGGRPREAKELLFFHLVSSRYEHASLIVTSTKSSL